VRPSESEPPPVAIRRLVIPLDGSALAEEALPTAQALATRLGVPLHLITAIDVLREIPAELGPVVAFDRGVYDKTRTQLDAAATSRLTQVSDQLQRDGLHVTTEIVHGSPFAAIADAVHPGDVIVMTSHGRGGVRRWLLGSVAEKLVREAPVPVVLVPVAVRQVTPSATTPVAG
jgi:nucleotide-binding universal stress UspA family protein